MKAQFFLLNSFQINNLVPTGIFQIFLLGSWWNLYQDLRLIQWGFPGGSVIMSPFACHCRRHRFDPWLEDPIYCRATKPVHHNYWAHALQQEKPPQWKACALQLESSPLLSPSKECPCSNKDPGQAKINRVIYIYICVCVCMCVCVCVCVYKRYILQCVLIHYSYYPYDACPILDSGNLFKLPLEVFLVWFWWVFTTWNDRMFLGSRYPRTGISHFSKKPWFTLMGNCTSRPQSGC